MSSKLKGVRTRIKEKMPEAMFMHCCPHKLTRCSYIQQNAILIAKLFLNTGMDERTYLLYEVGKSRLPKASPRRWSLNSRLVNSNHVPL